MSDSTRFHVRFESRYGWTVRRDGCEAHLSAHGTQWNAERSGRSLAQRARGTLTVHGIEGEIVRTDSYAPVSAP